MIDKIIAVLLCVIIFYCYKFLSCLRKLHLRCEGIVPLSRKLDSVVSVARRSVGDVQKVMSEVDTRLDLKLKRATYTLEEIRFMVERAEKAMDALQFIIELDRSAKKSIYKNPE